jgi:hypothetical protein
MVKRGEMTPIADSRCLSDGGLRRRWALFIAGWIGLSCITPATRAAENPRRSHQPSVEESATASAVVRAVEAFITAGESDDAAARAAYLAPDVFFYGHKRTRAQASRQITLLYRLWPQRKFVPTENIEVYAIPHHPGVYKVTAMVQYDMVNRQNERMTGRSRMTCILEHDRTGIRIVGVDEKLVR